MRHKPVLSSLLVWGALAAPAYAQTHHATGLIDDDPVALASVPFRPMYRAYLPPQADVIAYLPAIRSQGEQGSCTAWAAGYNAMSLLFNQKLSADSAASGGLKPLKIEFSPAYVFNLIHRGRCEGGTSVVTALDTIRDHGLVPYGSLPYDQQSCSALPSAAAVEEGKNKRLISYSRIDGDHKAVLEKMRGAIYAHKPVIVGMYTGDMASAFQTYNGGDIFRARLPHENAHAMVVVGYDDASQTFTVANSWGPQWGDKGFLRIDYQALLENLSGPTFVIDEIDDAGVRSILSSAPLNVEPEPKPAPVPVIEPPKPAPVVHDALPTVDDLKTQVMQLAQKPSCSAIRTQVSANRDIVLSGFVGAQADADALLRDVNGLPTRGRVQSQVQVHPWPQCEAYLNFEQELQDGGGLGVKLMDHALAPYTQGDTLSLQVTAPSFPSYLYVAYLQASGEVVYLSWPEPLAPKPTTPKTKLVFGGGKNGQPIYRVSKPFGDEMVIVIAASKPLFPGALPERDNDREFLTKFRTAFLAGGVKRHVAVAVLPIKTLAKESNP